MYPSIDSLHAGGRSLPAVVRPNAMKVCGIPLESKFEPFSEDRRYVLEFDSERFNAERTASASFAPAPPTVVFLPRFQYPESLQPGGARRLGVDVEVICHQSSVSVHCRVAIQFVVSVPLSVSVSVCGATLVRSAVGQGAYSGESCFCWGVGGVSV